MTVAEKRQKVLDVAAKEVGTTESPKNSNKTKYGKWFGLNGVAWCGIFVSWVFDEAGLPLPTIDFLKGYAGCQYAVKNVQKWGTVVTDPQPGDVAFFDWTAKKKYQHTGIVHSWKNKAVGTINTIEGNTAIGNDSNGGQVMRRERSIKNVLFVRPYVYA